MNEIEKFEQKCIKAWGKCERDFNQLFDNNTPRIKDLLNEKFENLTSYLKIHIADKLIRESKKHSGSFADSGDVFWYLLNFANEIEWEKGIFDNRRSLSIKSAIYLLLKGNSRKGYKYDFSKRRICDHIIAGGTSDRHSLFGFTI